MKPLDPAIKAAADAIYKMEAEFYREHISDEYGYLPCNDPRHAYDQAAWLAAARAYLEELGR